MENNDLTQPQFVFRKERDLGEIISDTFSFFTQNYKSILNIFLKFVGPFILLTILVTTYYQYKMGDLFSNITTFSEPDSAVSTILEDSWIIILLFAVSIATNIVLYGTILHIIKSYMNNNGEILEQDVSQGLKDDFWKLLGYLALTTIVGIIGFMLCFLPGIYLIVVLAPGIALLIMENESVSESFTKCFTLIKNNWWITFATFLVFGILIAILGFVFQLPAFIFSMVEGFTAFDQASDPTAITGLYQNWVYLLFTAIGSIGQSFLSIFTVIMIALVYFNLSEKQEFKGTYEQIDQIGN
ncbi:hypothetical protein [Flavobacterium sp. CS20]|jgi:hypothetical protein|uniref:hypothetical protein n=1 Tax=Flavobacterium sp. CS20 TaxID=2775246 RepID=UPI001B3A65EB|nr:hypothetical protein [Flavobacterium sp. CS20]QTY28090.1 hypothetical protein IGB25_06270 [Flavobacterium sp. CS20]